MAGMCPHALPVCFTCMCLRNQHDRLLGCWTHSHVPMSWNVHIHECNGQIYGCNG